MSNTQVRLTVFVAASLFIALLYLVISRVEHHETYKHLNQHLDAAGVRFHQTEDEVVAKLGEGEYMEGFGGHGRDYKDYGIRISIPTDKNSLMFGRVDAVECYGSDCSLYGIKKGDAIKKAEAAFLDQNYSETFDQGYSFENGEYVILLQGYEQVESFTVFFRDEDLRNRDY
ncbi:hypothetical protein DFQ01_13093 [Paenibacillus cellulosilyticus]|uniref:Uncharacterized protein n=1 Tax=Paenibacillus cellulosilyticus TaxID=375489 RepID=A0A2V2YM21_9BACL|nr:hypothetical protein [Paenibacillus cellulosilyticus]PWV94528.1 hypothetical protein DFQ01_13093 [Paenibacillus cellulosilyticus]QKS45032.1 hypothetical protein HUB94_11875 [Paenibacillus cellulosilyticus]